MICNVIAVEGIIERFTAEFTAFATCHDSLNYSWSPNEKYGASTLEERKSLTDCSLLTLFSAVGLIVHVPFNEQPQYFTQYLFNRFVHFCHWSNG